MKKKLFTIYIAVIICLIMKPVYGYYNYKTDELFVISLEAMQWLNIVFSILISLTLLTLYSIYKIKIQENTEEKIEKEKKKFEILKLVFSTVICAFIYFLYAYFWTEYPFKKIFLYIPMIIFIIAIIIKVLKQKILGNIICVINIICMILISTNLSKPIKEVIKYNEKIGEYMHLDYECDTMHSSDDSNVLDVRGLIQTIIEVNKSDRKVSIQYKDKTYTSEEELNKLMKTINTKANYNAKETYDSNGTYEQGKYDEYNQIYYINNIKLRPAYPTFMKFNMIKKFFGDSKNGSNVKLMIEEVIAYNNTGEFFIGIHGENIKKFDSEELDKACYKLNIYENENAEHSYENLEEAAKQMRELAKKISSGKNYKVEFLEENYTIVVSPLK